jgi:osmoprotectant transport system permease protein
MTSFAQLVIHNRSTSGGGEENCVASNGFCPSWIVDNFDRYLHPFWQHVYLSVIAVVCGFAIAFALALVAHRRRWLVGPIIGVTGVLYTLPSIAVFFLLQPITGRGALTALIALTAYTLLILFRNITTGLQNVPVETVDAARGLGFTANQVLWRVEVPLALPEIIAGLRIAATTTVGLATLAFFAGAGGLGGQIFSDITFKSNVVTAGLLCLGLAIVFDLILLGIQRLLTPWMRALPMESRRRWMLWRSGETVTA